jgi:hypothetical protein
MAGCCVSCCCTSCSLNNKLQLHTDVAIRHVQIKTTSFSFAHTIYSHTGLTYTPRCLGLACTTICYQW